MEEGRLSGFCIKAAGGNVNVDGTKCGRWNPTNEQVKILTDLFRSGVRTPTTDQIQKISNQLSFYGKIESKNVFYWFQNHKARERHKRRKLDNFLVRNHQENIHFSSPKYYATETKNNQVYLNPQSEAVIETLELFPLNSYGEKQVPDEKRRLINANEYYCKETTIDFQGEYLVTEIDHPPLDLRLSFI